MEEVVKKEVQARLKEIGKLIIVMEKDISDARAAGMDTKTQETQLTELKNKHVLMTGVYGTK